MRRPSLLHVVGASCPLTKEAARFKSPFFQPASRSREPWQTNKSPCNVLPLTITSPAFAHILLLMTLRGFIT